ncbi:Poly [ADP-ribose] polymerase 1 [Geranomyces variabilis]|uniref:Poly [ADP-ribose] polymerase n=1 Tax=Geranomyces variabilis TaxID=109894 RepID=A0AAD5TKU1_9FUNG|nr:Poly [ADP-ribose] polymerase 1 [Geranomyces variabilis]
MEAGDFVVEYAKSGRAKCQSCRTSIAQGAVRAGTVVQGFNFDGLTTQWQHPHCLTKKPAAKRLCQDNLHGLSNLRWEDQEEFIKAFPAAGGGPAANPHGLQVDFAKSSRSTCKGCQKSIDQGQMRIGVAVDEEVGVARKFHLAVPAWHHPECFFEYHAQKVVNGIDSFDGLNQLDEWSVKVLTALVNGEEPPSKPDDIGKDADGEKNSVDHKIKDEFRQLRSSKRTATAAVADENVKPVKRVKIKKEKDAANMKKDPETSTRQFEIRDQTNAIWAARDLLPTSRQNKTKYLDILTANGINGIAHKSVCDLVDILADAMVFGVAQLCPACGTTRLVAAESNYKCPAHLEWGRCGFVADDAEFEPLYVEPDSTLPWTETYHYHPRPRLFARAPKARSNAQPLPSGDDLKAEIKFKRAKNEEAVIKTNTPFANRAFIFAGRLPSSQQHYQSLVAEGGGSVLTSPQAQAEGLVLLVTNKPEMEKNSKKIQDARTAGIDVVDCSYITDCFEKGTRLNYKDEGYLLETNSVAEPAVPIREAHQRRARGEETQERAPKTDRLTIKDGAVVDPESGLGHSHHVYKEGDLLWSAVLSKADVAANKNSYYKLQLLASDKGRGYVVFRSWGRVGTTSGNTKIEQMDLESCKEAFETLYKKQSGNDFGDPNPVKHPGLYHALEIAGVSDHANDDLEDVSRPSKIASKLAPQVQDLVKLIFDVKNLTNAMEEMEIDLNKMPLGKLSPKMMTEAYVVLSEAMDLVLKGAHGVADRTKIVQLSNHFFSVIPHDFGSNTAPLLDNPDIIRAKLETLDALKEIEIATGMLKKEKNSAGESKEHPIDKEFKKLKTAVTVLDASSEEHQLIERCTKTTHAPTHSDYTLAIKNIFKIERSGERALYSGGPIGNKALLWHGSRISNYAGILSQGLRIAPPEAPTTGFMFGKACYFASMVSKSANYCNASRRQRTGLLLLAEVALGEQMELVESTFVEKLPPGIHSVKGCGKTGPSTWERLPNVADDDPILVPIGPPKKQELPGRAKTTELLYDEYMIYDESQCTLRYLVEVQFTFKK